MRFSVALFLGGKMHSSFKVLGLSSAFSTSQNSTTEEYKLVQQEPESRESVSSAELHTRGMEGLVKTAWGAGWVAQAQEEVFAYRRLLLLQRAAAASGTAVATGASTAVGATAASGTTVASGAATVSVGYVAAMSVLAVASFGAGALTGSGINYLPNLFGHEKTVGDHLGDAATAVFGPCDTQGTFFKVGEFLGLA